jgi:hypothetical protein
MSIPKEYIGRWRLVEMSAWEQEYIDEIVPGRIVIRRNATGEFQFGCVQGEMDCSMDAIGKEHFLGFSWEGSDEADPASGRGWLVVAGREMTGKICFHHGDESDVKAVKE